MVLGKLPVLGRPTYLDHSVARAYCACSGFGWGLFGHFFSRLSFLFSFSLSLGDGPILTEILSQRTKTNNQSYKPTSSTCTSWIWNGGKCPFYRKNLSISTDRSGQIAKTQIRLLLWEQSDFSLHCLPFYFHLLNPFRSILFLVQLQLLSYCFRCPILRTFTVYGALIVLCIVYCFWVTTKLRKRWKSWLYYDCSIINHAEGVLQRYCIPMSIMCSLLWINITVYVCRQIDINKERKRLIPASSSVNYCIC